METQLEETFSLVFAQSSEYFGGIQHVVVRVKLVGVEGEQWQIEQEGEPVSIDQEQEGQETMKSGFWKDIIV